MFGPLLPQHQDIWCRRPCPQPRETPPGLAPRPRRPAGTAPPPGARPGAAAPQSRRHPARQPRLGQRLWREAAAREAPSASGPAGREKMPGRPPPPELRRPGPARPAAGPRYPPSGRPAALGAAARAGASSELGRPQRGDGAAAERRLGWAAPPARPCPALPARFPAPGSQASRCPHLRDRRGLLLHPRTASPLRKERFGRRFPA